MSVVIEVKRFSYDSKRQKGTVQLRISGLGQEPSVKEVELCDGDTVTLHGPDDVPKDVKKPVVKGNGKTVYPEKPISDVGA